MVEIIEPSEAENWFAENGADLEAKYPGEWVVMPNENPADYAHHAERRTALAKIRNRYGESAKSCSHYCPAEKPDTEV